MATLVFLIVFAIVAVVVMVDENKVKVVHYRAMRKMRAMTHRD